MSSKLPYRPPKKPTQFQYQYQQTWGPIWGCLLGIGLGALLLLWPALAWHGQTAAGGWRWDIHTTVACCIWWGVVLFVAVAIVLGKANTPEVRAREQQGQAANLPPSPRGEAANMPPSSPSPVARYAQALRLRSRRNLRVPPYSPRPR